MFRKLTLTFFVAGISFIAIAQKNLTVQDIAGSWKLAAFNLGGVYFDFAKDSIDLDPDIKATIEKGKEKETLASIKNNLAPYKEGSLRISNDGKYFQRLMGEEANATYTLEKRNNLYYLIVVNDNTEKTVDTLRVWKDKGWLYIRYESEEGTVSLLMFEKE